MAQTRVITLDLNFQGRPHAIASYLIRPPKGDAAVLIESGFMSNPSEARNIFSPTWRRQMAQAIANGISKYAKTVQP